jgi:hypothetical protein
MRHVESATARPMARHAPQLRLVRAGIGLAALDQRLLTTPRGDQRRRRRRAERGSGEWDGGDPLTRGARRWCCRGVRPGVEHSAGEASRRLGYPTTTASLLSAEALVTHAGRAMWAARGFAAVDMETAVLAGRVPRIAAVRVMLDTPSQEISPAWERPGRAALDPRNWREGDWLARAAPRLSRRAALVVAAALADAKVTPRV